MQMLGMHLKCGLCMEVIYLASQDILLGLGLTVFDELEFCRHRKS